MNDETVLKIIRDNRKAEEARMRPRVREMLDVIRAGVKILATRDGLPITDEHVDERARTITQTLLSIEWIESGANETVGCEHNPSLDPGQYCGAPAVAVRDGTSLCAQHERQYAALTAQAAAEDLVESSADLEDKLDGFLANADDTQPMICRVHGRAAFECQCAQVLWASVRR